MAVESKVAKKGARRQVPARAKPDAPWKLGEGQVAVALMVQALTLLDNPEMSAAAELLRRAIEAAGGMV